MKSPCSALQSDVLSRFPIELKSDILSRLPIELLLQLRCCCKAFRDLIDDPYFRRLNTDRVILASRSVSTSLSFLTLIQFNEEKDCKFHFAKYDDVSNDYEVNEAIMYPPLKVRDKGSENIIIGSCNGLVCYFHHHRTMFYPIYIFNPVTREQLKLTLANEFVRGPRYVVNGFGYHPVTKEYKVVRIYYDNPFCAVGEVEVYTLGTGEWRNIGEVNPSLCNVLYDSPGALVNGALYWHDDSGTILSFDLATEIFHLVPLPLPFTLDAEFDVTYFDLCLWKECLCLVRLRHSCRGGLLHIWVMNKDDQSWKEEFNVPFLDPSLSKLFLIDCPFITCAESGKVLLWYNDKILTSYDLEKKERRVYGENKANCFHEIVLHVKSFVSLKDLGEDAKIIDWK